MGGLFAYLNFDLNRERCHILRVLFNGLRRLEHHSYDSAGIAIDSSMSRRTSYPEGITFSDSDLTSYPFLVFRQEGTVSALIESVYKEMDELELKKVFSTHAGIAHTRWATREPAERNSHPQTSGLDHGFLVIQNGLITNYEVLKEYLISHNYTFTSDTDTEVIALLAKFVYDSANNAKETGDQGITFSQVVLEVMQHLEGPYALIFKSSYFPNELVACKYGSQLLLGINEFTDDEDDFSAFVNNKLPSKDGNPKELFLSNDAKLVVQHSKRVHVIDDGEVVHVKDGGVSILKYKDGDSSLVRRGAIDLLKVKQKVVFKKTECDEKQSK